MTVARCEQVSVDSTPYYHCVSRCVRRAFLCGEDRGTGKNFDHRKGWLTARMKELASVFAIDICAYAAMSNHYHLVVRIGFERAQAWSDEEVRERYGQLFKLSKSQAETVSKKELRRLTKLWRERLCDLSWFMRCLNESIARRANKEDGCTGRFWEGRFRSQALLDEGALLTCMSYVDLNPVRAGRAQRLEDADFTSIQERLREARGARRKSAERMRSGSQGPKGNKANRTRKTRPQQAPLMPFARPGRKHGGLSESETVPMLFEDYIDLVEWTGQAIRDDKRSASLPARAQTTLERLGLDTNHWVDTIRDYERRFFSMVGQVHHIRFEAERQGRLRVKGVGWADRLYRVGSAA